MRTIELHQLDAFTNELFGGNPTGVVSNADELTEQDMQHIAREMNVSETAFVLDSTQTDADFRLRFFTPAGAEIDFCGHATIGALAQLARLGRYSLDKDSHTTHVQTNAGTLPMAATSKNGTPEITFTAPGINMEAYELQSNALAQKLGIPPELIDDQAITLIDRNLRYVYIPTVSLEKLGGQVFDFSRIKQQFADEKIVVFCLYSNETISQESDLHARGLAPLVGVDEDPFTGSMQAGLVQAAKKNSYIPQGQEIIRSEQGHFIGRPGAAVIHHSKTGDITVSAQAVSVFSTTLELA